MADGGIWALGGYLYQTIGVLGIGAFITNHGENELVQGSELDLLIQLVGVNRQDALRIQPEVYNNDALIFYGLKITDEGVIVQFKYSSRIPAPTIGPADVDRIVNTFDESVARARANGINISACVLITNRNFAQGDGTGGERWQEAKISKQADYELREIVEIQPENFKSELITYAKRRGVLDREIDAGISRLIGEIIIQAVYREINPNSFRFTLNEAFTDFQNTASISVEDLNELCARDLREYGDYFLGLSPWNFEPITRKALSDLALQISQRALVTIYGPGGCGKSVLVWQLLWLNKQYCICKIDAASKIINNWLPRLVNHSMRGLPHEICPNDSNEVAIQRLVNANLNGQKPILWLGLDGLDEGAISLDQKALLRDVINSFWTYDQETLKNGIPPDAVLILTFREKNHLVELFGYLPNHDYMSPPAINLSEFDHTEITKGFEKFFSERLNKGLIPFYDQNNHSLLELDINENYEIQGDKGVLGALQHPIIWHALLQLDRQEQEDALDGNIQALMSLAENILIWFDYKVQRRSSNIVPLNNSTQVLANIARNTSANNLLSMRIWLDAAHDYGEILARTLYNEAASGGLIELESNQSWHWKHQFIYDYLINYQG